MPVVKNPSPPDIASGCARSTLPDVPGGSVPSRSCAEAWPPEDAARYIEDLSAELAHVARAADLDLVAYLLDIVRLEASRAGKRITPEAP